VREYGWPYRIRKAHLHQGAAARHTQHMHHSSPCCDIRSGLSHAGRRLSSRPGAQAHARSGGAAVAAWIVRMPLHSSRTATHPLAFAHRGPDRVNLLAGCICVMPCRPWKNGILFRYRCRVFAALRLNKRTFRFAATSFAEHSVRYLLLGASLRK
jgi:hypothetical protein